MGEVQDHGVPSQPESSTGRADFGHQPEPYQSAATGVGGILRDVFTMGARPIACLNSLRFGEIDGADADRVRYGC